MDDFIMDAPYQKGVDIGNSAKKMRDTRARKKTISLEKVLTFQLNLW